MCIRDRAEAWVRQIEMALRHGQPTDAAYAAALSASDKITAADPQSISGPLKKEFAAMITMSVISVGLSSNERVRDCLAAAEQVFAKQPGHPYASDAASTCYVGAAEIARQHGEDPQHLLHKALQLMEPTIQRHSHFLWGINDLGLSLIHISEPTRPY